MPIYVYKCESCGVTKDVLQKMSDSPLTDCPVCGAAAFKKQLTSAGFQLKGSGWYATDFKGGGAPADAGAAKTDGPDGATGKPVADSVTKPESTPSAAPAPAPTAAPAASSAGSNASAGQ